MGATALRCSVLRGGTSKGLYFRTDDLPADRPTRDAVLLSAMGAPHPRGIDGMSGGHPLTSKVAMVRRSRRADADVDYRFAQVWPDRAEVSENQTCGNLLAGVGPFALEEGLVEAAGEVTPVRIWMENTSSLAVARVQTPGGTVTYEGSTRIDGVPGRHARVDLEFVDVAGSSCGALLPTGRTRDEIDGVSVTCIDHGMPVVCVRAVDVGLTGQETPAEIEADERVLARLESIRLAAGPRMNLGDVTTKTVPKVTLLAAAANGGVVGTRTLVPHRVHDAIGVLGAVSVATACVVPGTVASGLAELPDVPTGGGRLDLDIEHPSGSFTVTLDVVTVDGRLTVLAAALVRTARLLMRGDVFVPASVWSPS